MMSFAKVPESNYRFFVTAMQNKKPERMPLVSFENRFSRLCHQLRGIELYF